MGEQNTQHVIDDPGDKRLVERGSEMIRVSPGRRSARHAVHWDRSTLVPVALSVQDLQAVFGLQRVELRLRVLICGETLACPVLSAMVRTLSKPMSRSVLCGVDFVVVF